LTNHVAGNWGALGGCINAGFEIITFLRGKSYSLPLGASAGQTLGWMVVQAILIGLGFIAGYALNDANQLGGIMAAIGSGMAAPEILKKAGRALS
jgi:hypothetical protein